MNPEKYMGMTFKNRGRSRTHGDCWQLCRLIYKDELHVELSNLNGYTDSEDDQQISRVIIGESAENWIRVDKPQMYDIVVLALAGKPCHVGVMMSDSAFIQLLKKRGVTIERISNVLWRSRVEGYFRYVGERG